MKQTSVATFTALMITLCIYGPNVTDLIQKDNTLYFALCGIALMGFCFAVIWTGKRDKMNREKSFEEKLSHDLNEIARSKDEIA